MHRAVWAAGVADAASAFAYVNHMVADHAWQLARPVGKHMRVLDLGCGVGGTLFDIQRDLLSHGVQIEGVGISISSTQIQIAEGTARQRNLPIHFVEANFLELPFSAQFDLAIGIESFIHAPDPAALYTATAAALRPGGRLIVCDDFLRNTPGDDVLEQAFRRGWLAAGLLTQAQAHSYAQAAGLGLLEQRNLTPDLRLLRWPTPLVRTLLGAGLGLPLEWALMQNFVGGLALQHGLAQAVFGYYWNVFVKQ